jgi:hypothetical protein
MGFDFGRGRHGAENGGCAFYSSCKFLLWFRFSSASVLPVFDQDIIGALKPGCFLASSEKGITGQSHGCFD